jgi:rare lipoprotein A
LDLRRAAAATATLLFALLLTGCHHKAKVSRRYPPPPPASRRDPYSYPETRRAAPAPLPPANDNAIASGRANTVETGLASWYGPPYHNRQSANGQIYDQNAMTAAHRTLPMGTTVRVTNLSTGQNTVVTITDRGPFVHGRIIDLSLAAAKVTGLYRMGVAQVRVDVLQERPGAELNGRWCIQIGAFLEKNNALRLQSELQRQYSTTARVIEFQGPTGHWVRINPLVPDRRRAQQIAATIRTAEPDAIPYLVRLD